MRNPEIYDGHADFYLAGDLIYHGEGCALDPGYLEFVNETDRADSQIVMSESAASCWMNKFAQSDIGVVTLNEDTVNKFWADSGYERENAVFDTTSMQEHYPVLEHKIGPNKALEMDVSFKNVQVQFAEENSDIYLNCTMGFNVSYWEP